MNPKQRYRVSEKGRAENRERMRRRRALLRGAAETMRRQINWLGWSLCHACLVIHPARGIEVDHIIPLGFGGTDCLGNVQPLCTACHLDKTIREHSRRAA